MITNEWQQAGRVEVPRDHWKRPLIIPPEGGKPTAYTRCTKYVDALEDTYNLMRWGERMTALGLTARPDLALAVSSLGPQPEDDDDAKAWRERLNRICETAKEAAGSDIASTIGTALHALTDRVDRGLELGPVPIEYARHIAAYTEATAKITPIHSEIFTVLDKLMIGGTPDRVVTIDGLPGGYIADLKTGRTDYGVGKMAMQLAVYAHSLIYDPTTGARTPYAADVSPDWGLIIALSAKTGECRLMWIDLAAGWQAVQLAAEVREWRRRRNLTADRHPAEVVTERLDTFGDTAAVAALGVAINAATSEAELIALWSAAGDRWTPVHTAAAAARKAELIGTYRQETA